ncbi:hypothetical protein Pcinc_042375, partial [Petrolisthes cinctipes]
STKVCGDVGVRKVVLSERSLGDFSSEVAAFWSADLLHDDDDLDSDEDLDLDLYGPV